MYLSTKERDRRYERIRERMVEENLLVLLVIGNNHATGSPFFATGNFRYLTDYFIFTLYGMLLFFREGNPILLAPGEIVEVYGKRHSWIDDVRVSLNYADTVAQVLERNGLIRSRVGFLGMESIPASTYLALREKLPNAEFVDASSILLPLRFVKSEEERKLMEKAAELNDGGYKELLKRIYPGMKEFEVVGILEGYHRGNGADRTFNLISSGPFPASREGTPFQGLPWFPSQREIQKGDSVLLEMTNVYGGYWNQLVRTVSVGGENSELLRFQKAAVKTIQSGLEGMKVGTKTSQIVSSMAETLEKCGFHLTTPMGHFVGIDLIEGRVDFQSPVVLAPGMATILHPRVSDPKTGVNSILWGQTYFMTDSGPVKLNQTEEDVLHCV